MNAKTITLEVNIDQANLILEGLGLLPFVRVYELIGEIQEQARRQLGGAPRPAVPSGPPSPSIAAEAHE